MILRAATIYQATVTGLYSIIVRRLAFGIGFPSVYSAVLLCIARI